MQTELKYAAELKALHEYTKYDEVVYFCHEKFCVSF